MRLSKTLSKEESLTGDLIPPGIYPFEVLDAEDTKSQKGNDMIKIKLGLLMPDGRPRVIIDYLLEALEYKLAHFFDCIGKWELYQSGNFSADDCYGCSGEVKVYIQKSKDSQYGDKSAVADYILSDAQQYEKMERKTEAAKKGVEPGFDDDLPF